MPSLRLLFQVQITAQSASLSSERNTLLSVVIHIVKPRAEKYFPSDLGFVPKSPNIHGILSRSASRMTSAADCGFLRRTPTLYIATTPQPTFLSRLPNLPYCSEEARGSLWRKM